MAAKSTSTRYEYNYDDDPRDGLSHLSDSFPVMKRSAEKKIRLPVILTKPTKEMAEEFGVDPDVAHVMFGEASDQGRVPNYVIDEVLDPVLKTFQKEHLTSSLSEFDESKGNVKQIATAELRFRKCGKEWDRSWRLNEYKFEEIGEVDYFTVDTE